MRSFPAPGQLWERDPLPLVPCPTCPERGGNRLPVVNPTDTASTGRTTVHRIEVCALASNRLPPHPSLPRKRRGF